MKTQAIFTAKMGKRHIRAKTNKAMGRKSKRVRASKTKIR